MGDSEDFLLNGELWNDSYPDYITEDLDPEDEFMRIVGMVVMAAALAGVFGNIIVLIFSFGYVRGDFRHYVANLAVVDIFCGLLFAFIGFINVDQQKNRFSISVMTYSALAFYGSFGVMVCALVPISVSRIIALSNTEKTTKIFKGRRSCLICIFFDVLPISVLYIICIVDHDIARWLFFIYAGLTVFAYLIAFASNYMVFRIVARHIKVVQNLRDQARLLETRQVALATLAQALVPLVCQVPAFLTLSSALLLTEPITNGTTIAITQLWLASSPLLDAIITVLIIKQYRKETLRCFRLVSKTVKESRKSNALYTEENEAFETKL